jgi:uncharacterized membrane protein
MVVGVFDIYDQAMRAERDLEAAGFPREDFSVVMKREGSAPHLGAEQTHAAQGTAAGAAVGAAAGAAAGLALLAIPGLGPLLAIGPIATAITAALSGAGIGGLAGSFVGLGVPTDHAKAYEEAVRAGGVVLAVRVQTPDEADRALQSLRAHGAREVNRFEDQM